MESRLDSAQITMTKAELAAFARSVAEEVVARLDAAERLQTHEAVIETGTLAVNLPGYEAVVDGVPIKLKTRDFALLAALARKRWSCIKTRATARTCVAGAGRRRPESYRRRPHPPHTCCAAICGIFGRDGSRHRLQTREGVDTSTGRGLNDCGPGEIRGRITSCIRAAYAGVMLRCFALRMENKSTPISVDARRVAVVARELSFDLLRAIEAAVPCALAEVADDLGPVRLSQLAERVFSETKARYAVNAAATLLAALAGNRR